jgi:hypothetical protein
MKRQRDRQRAKTAFKRSSFVEVAVEEARLPGEWPEEAH